MKKKRAPQKLISFSDNESDIERIRSDIKDGWSIISLIQTGNYYVGVMEKSSSSSHNINDETSLFIPPRKKIKIL